MRRLCQRGTDHHGLPRRGHAVPLLLEAGVHCGKDAVVLHRGDVTWDIGEPHPFCSERSSIPSARAIDGLHGVIDVFLGGDGLLRRNAAESLEEAGVLHLTALERGLSSISSLYGAAQGLLCIVRTSSNRTNGGRLRARTPAGEGMNLALPEASRCPYACSCASHSLPGTLHTSRRHRAAQTPGSKPGGAPHDRSLLRPTKRPTNASAKGLADAGPFRAGITIALHTPNPSANQGAASRANSSESTGATQS